MSYSELTFEIEQSLAQECCELLEDLGAAAVSFYDAEDKPLLEPLPGSIPLWPKVKIVGLFEKNFSPSIVEKLKGIYPTKHFSLSNLEEREWSRTWLDHFRPMQFGQHLWVAPFDYAFQTDNTEAVILRLDPGLAFGTGTHPTTELCLRWLDAHSPHGKQIIDYGCGSGILGIAAILLGAEKVVAIDYDPQALWSTRENAHRNNVCEEKLVTLHPDDLPEPLPKAQVILANILAEPLIHLAPRIRDCCELGGTIVLSGLLLSQMDAVKIAYSSWFEFEPPTTKEDWVLLTAKRIV